MIDTLSFSVFTKRDLKRVMAIENAVFPEPWSNVVFNSELSLKTGRAYRVVRVDGLLVAYYGLLFTDDEAHVTTFAVEPESQHRGIGTAVMWHAVTLAREAGMHHISLEVAAGNERAQRLYRAFGFVPVGVRKRYYPKTGEDAYVMWVRDIDSDAYAERLARIEAAVRSRT